MVQPKWTITKISKHKTEKHPFLYYGSFCKFHLFLIILSNCKAHLIMFGMESVLNKFQLSLVFIIIIIVISVIYKVNN